MCCNCNQPITICFDQIESGRDAKFSDAFTNRKVSDANVSDIALLARYLVMSSHVDSNDAVNRVVEHMVSGESNTLKDVIAWIKRYWF